MEVHMAGETQRAIERSIQSRVRDDKPLGLSLMLYMVGGVGTIPGWWSKARDAKLREFWKNNDYLAGAVYAVCSRMATIPVNVEPWDENVTAHVDQAWKFERILLDASEFGQGFDTFVTKWTEDLLTQDNGAFAEIIGDGEPTGPIIGMPFGVAHLDSYRCARTSNPEYPVVYTDTNGDRFRLHHTRVAYASLQPSPISEMLGVGFCSISRCINTSQHLMDVLTFKQEKLGSRPSRGMMVTKGGLDPEDVRAAMEIANDAMDSQQLNRFSKVAVVGSQSLPDAGLELVALSSLPDGFDEQQSTTIGMAAIALAFGVDPRELWPGLSVGSTRAEALVAHLKARTKGIGQIIAITERAIGQKFLPPTLYMEFDYQDDAQDRQVADIRAVRGTTAETNLRSKALDMRTVRQQMLQAGDISNAQYEELELQDGRLPDGTSVLSLFNHPDYKAMLNLGVPDPLLLDKTELKPLVEEKKVELLTGLGVVKDFRTRKMMQEALKAVETLVEEPIAKAAVPPALAAAALTAGSPPAAPENVPAGGPEAGTPGGEEAGQEEGIEEVVLE
jgi:hypothetical protein